MGKYDHIINEPRNPGKSYKDYFTKVPPHDYADEAAPVPNLHSSYRTSNYNRLQNVLHPLPDGHHEGCILHRDGPVAPPQT